MMKGEEGVQGPESGIMQIVLFRIGGEEAGLDIAGVREIVRPERLTRVPNAPDYVVGVINLRGQIITVCSLHRRLGIRETGAVERFVLVAESRGHTIGLLVDGVTGVVKVSAPDISSTPALLRAHEGSRYLKGIVRLGERLVILVDIEAFLSDELAQESGG